MPELNKDEYGQILTVNFATDLSTATELKMYIQPKYGEELEKTATLGTVNISVGDENYLANQYIVYTTQDGDIDQSGQWRKKGTAQMNSTTKNTTDYTHFTVLD